MMTETPDSIIGFWFGSSDSPVEINAQKKTLWWFKSKEIDADIKQRFASLSKAVHVSLPDEWKDEPRSLLAAIICLDQFPRNMYRGLPEAFSYDPRARELALQLVDSGKDRELLNMHRVFCYLPFEHSEDIDDQQRAIALYKNLLSEVVSSGANKEVCDIFEHSYQFAVRHLEIIERFGRFPHRNSIMGRPSSEEELDFLSQPGSSF